MVLDRGEFLEDGINVMDCSTGITIYFDVGVSEWWDARQVGVTYKQGLLSHLQRPVFKFGKCVLVTIWFRFL